jgi:nucleotide-binding universal stress UspA family protein
MVQIPTPFPPPRAPVPALGIVLCAVDGSPAAASVLYAAAGLAAHPGSRLIVLRVEDRMDSEDERVAAQVALEEFALRAVPGWIVYREATDLIAVAGHPSHMILKIATERGASLIVMGTHSRGSLARALFGSVTARVLRETTIPVAVVPPSAGELISLTDNDAVPHLGTVLVPVDLHEGSARQLAFAKLLSLASDREITLLHVISPTDDSEGPLKRLQDMAAHVDARSGVRAIVTHGSLIHAIRDRQLREHAGVVVMGRDPGSPGRVACELLQDTSAVVVFVP